MLGRLLLFVKKTYSLNYVRKNFGGRELKVYYHNYSARRAISLFPQREKAFREEIKRNLTDNVASSATKGGVLIDIGANIGLYAMDFQSIPNLRVIAIDADPEIYPVLVKNTSSLDGIESINCAVLGGSGIRQKKVAGFRNAGSGSSKPILDETCNISGQGEVATMSLSDLLAVKCSTSDRVALIIDIEGYEGDLLMEFDSVAHYNWWFVAVELHQRELRKKGLQLADLICSMQNAGFYLHWLRVPEKNIHSHGQTHAIFKKVDPRFHPRSV